MLLIISYAWVGMDARGSGASFGNRSTAFSPDEIEDGREILDWVVSQPWSSGFTGTLGVSYDGIAAELLASRRHPSMKLATVFFSPFDLYTDVRGLLVLCSRSSRCSHRHFLPVHRARWHPLRVVHQGVGRTELAPRLE